MFLRRELWLPFERELHSDATNFIHSSIISDRTAFHAARAIEARWPRAKQRPSVANSSVRRFVVLRCVEG